MIRHPFDDPDAHIGQLREELSARLGREVDLLTSEPTREEPQGVLIATPKGVDEPLDLDPAVVAEVVAAHVPTERVSPEKASLEALRAATTVAQRVAVFQSYLEAQVAVQEKARERAREARRERRHLRWGQQLGPVNGPHPGPLGGSPPA